LEKVLGVVGKNNVEASAKVGAALAERAKAAGIEECYFDRGAFCGPPLIVEKEDQRDERARPT